MSCICICSCMCSAGVFIYQHIHMPCVFVCLSAHCRWSNKASHGTTRHWMGWDKMGWDGIGAGPCKSAWGRCAAVSVRLVAFSFSCRFESLRIASNRFLIIPCTAPVGQAGVSNEMGTFVGWILSLKMCQISTLRFQERVNKFANDKFNGERSW